MCDFKQQGLSVCFVSKIEMAVTVTIQAGVGVLVGDKTQGQKTPLYWTENWNCTMFSQIGRHF